MQRFHLYFIAKTFFITMIGLFVVQSHVDAQRTAILPLTHRRGVAVPRIWPQVMSEFRAELAQIQTLTIREEDSDTRVEAVEACVEPYKQECIRLMMLNAELDLVLRPSIARNRQRRTLLSITVTFGDGTVEHTQIETDVVEQTHGRSLAHAVIELIHTHDGTTVQHNSANASTSSLTNMTIETPPVTTPLVATTPITAPPIVTTPVVSTPPVTPPHETSTVLTNSTERQPSTVNYAIGVPSLVGGVALTIFSSVRISQQGECLSVDDPEASCTHPFGSGQQREAGSLTIGAISAGIGLSAIGATFITARPIRVRVEATTQSAFVGASFTY